VRSSSAKELRAKALLEQMQARERLEQARAAQLAEKNARMLEELDTFRGKHLDPNAAHWDEVSLLLGVMLMSESSC
jgi:hypothetical protein